MFKWVIFLLMASVASGTTYTVDDSGGKDYTTIQAGVDAATTPGDVVEVYSGTYTEQVTMGTSGTSDSLITLRVKTGETAYIFGGEAITGWTLCEVDEPNLIVGGVVNPNYGEIYWASVPSSSITDPIYKMLMFEDGTHCRIARDPNQALGYGLDIDLFTDLTAEAAGISDGLIDSSDLTQADDYWNGAYVAIDIALANNQVETKTISDFVSADDKLIFDTSTSENMSSGDSYSIINHPHSLDGAGEFYIAPAASSRNRIYFWPSDSNNLSADIAIPTKGYGIYGTGKDYITISGFEVYGQSATGIRFTGSAGDYVDGITIGDCNIYDILDHALYVTYANDVNVHDCYAQRTQNSKRGIMLNGCTNGYIQDCTVSDTGSTNISMYSVTGGQIRDNNVHGIVGGHGNGISAYESCDTILIAYNTFHNRSNLALENHANVCIYANTLNFDEAVNNGFATWGGVESGYYFCAHNVSIQSGNNTGIVHCNDEDVNAVVVNNICDGHQDWRYTNLDEYGYNIYPGLHYLQKSKYGWSLESYSIVETDMDTIFTDYSNEDYTILENSPADGAGVNIQTMLSDLGIDTDFSDFDFTKDKAGEDWADPPSIGAYEATESTPPVGPGGGGLYGGDGSTTYLF